MVSAKGALYLSEQTFGDVVAELVAEQNIGHLYKPRKLPLSISQWRNIANHNSYEVSENQVTCTYGSAGKEKSITLTLDELVQVFHECNSIYYAHKIAYEFFYIDNLEALLKRNQEITVSEYSMETSLVYGLVSEGFSIIRAELADRKWILVLSDTKNRSREDAKSSLRLACHQYLMFVEFVEFSISIKAENDEYTVGFICAALAGAQIVDGK